MAWPRSALYLAAVIMLGSAVTAHEVAGRGEPVVEARTQVASPTEDPQSATQGADALDLALLDRPRAEFAAPNLFGRPLPPTPARPAPATPAIASAAPSRPAPPSAPPLPFKYLGRMIDGDRSFVFLSRNQETLSASAGEALGQDYRLERIEESTISFVYVPLGLRQTLQIPSSPQGSKP